MVVAFHKDTGEVIWRAVSHQSMGYCPPVIIEAGGTRQLIVWLPEEIVSLDPRTGAVYWRQSFHCKQGLSVVTPAFDGTRLFVSTAWRGGCMLRLAADRPAASVLWAGTEDIGIHKTWGIHCLMSTPYLKDGRVYGVCHYGELRCLNADTGDRIWESLQPTGKNPWSNAFLIPRGGRTMIANEHGELIIARLAPTGYEEISRATLLAPTTRAGSRTVVWSHPAFAGRSIFARNDREIICASLAAGGEAPDSR
jgi:outer membrane protein assembly factor BamB